MSDNKKRKINYSVDLLFSWAGISLQVFGNRYFIWSENGFTLSHTTCPHCHLEVAYGFGLLSFLLGGATSSLP